MKLALLGISGRTGLEVATLALSRGYTIQALARDPAKVKLVDSRLQIFQGDAREGTAVDRVVAGADAVVTALGPARGSFVLAAPATRNVLAAMRHHQVPTLVVLSGAAMRLEGEKVAHWRHRILLGLGRLLLGPVLRDKTDEVRLLEATSDIQWVLVRPPRLTNGRATGSYRADLAGPPSMSIARADLARFMLDQAERPTFARQAPFVSA